MRSKISLKRSLIVLGIAGIIFSSIIIFFLTLDLSSPTSGQASQNPQQADLIRFPIRLRIPKINIDAAVEHVGLTSHGTMDVPKGPADVAWFDLGPRPGEDGNAVIAGHEGWKNGIPAVFDNLYKLQKGDELYVEDEKGAITTFVVREVRMYGENEDASVVFGSSDGKAHLNLITCEGIWNAAQKSYSNRLVVFTDKEIEL